MIKSCYVVLVVCMCIGASSCTKNKTVPQEDLSTQEEWESLFNGQNLDGWTVKIHHHDPGVNFGNTFRVEDGVLQVRYDEYGDFNEQFGHLYYDEAFSHYRLVLEYRFVGEMESTAPEYVIRNSGVMIHAQDPQNMLKEQNWPISVEMQFLGGLEDGQPRPTGNMCSPGTHVVYEEELDTRHCINSTSETYFGDQWVKAEIEVYGDSLVIHRIEGDEVLRYTHPQMGGNVASGYDPDEFEEGRLLNKGFIALQSEGQPLDFRNIKLLNLSGCMDPGASNYKSYYLDSKPEICE